MEQINNLPPPQKALVALVVMALLAGAAYQFVIRDRQSQAQAAQASYQRHRNEYDQLREYEQKQRLESAQAARAEAEQKLKENKRLLPAEDEIPSFIMSIKADADHSGLDVLRFESTTPEFEDYYKRIPVQVEVIGRTTDLISFLQTLAQPHKRIVNVSEFDIERLPRDHEAHQGRVGGEAARAARRRTRIEETPDMSPEERRLVRFRHWQQGSEQNLVKATFTAYTFSYTGEQLSEDQRRRRQTRRR